MNTGIFKDLIEEFQGLNVEELKAASTDDSLIMLCTRLDCVPIAVEMLTGKVPTEDDLRFAREVLENEDESVSVEERAKLLVQSFRFSGSIDGEPVREMDEAEILGLYQERSGAAFGSAAQ